MNETPKISNSNDNKINNNINTKTNTNINTNTNTNSNTNTKTNSDTNTNINTKISTNTNTNGKGTLSSDSTAVIHKFPQYPFCFDYDAGQCWACVSGYLLNLVVNQCVPYVKPTTPKLAPSADKPVEPKPTPSDNCNLFN